MWRRSTHGDEIGLPLVLKIKQHGLGCGSVDMAFTKQARSPGFDPQHHIHPAW